MIYEMCNCGVAAWVHKRPLSNFDIFPHNLCLFYIVKKHSVAKIMAVNIS